MTTVSQRLHYIEWSPIIAGTIVACAVSILLLQASHALGLSFNYLESAKVITPGKVLTIGLWTLWIQLLASVTGGYLAGRMSNNWDGKHESELRDGAHGLLTWALSTVLTAIAIGISATVATFAVQNGADVATTITPDMAKRITIVSGFSLFAISLVSAVVAWYAATVGGDHRDRRVDVSKRLTFRRR